MKSRDNLLTECRDEAIRQGHSGREWTPTAEDLQWIERQIAESASPRPWTADERDEAIDAARRVGGVVVATAGLDGYEVLGERSACPRTRWWRGRNGLPVVAP